MSEIIDSVVMKDILYVVHYALDRKYQRTAIANVQNAL